LHPIIRFAGEDDIVFPMARLDRELNEYEVVQNLGEGVTLEIAGGGATCCARATPSTAGRAQHALIYDGRTRVRLLFCHHDWHREGAASLTEPDDPLDPWRWPAFLAAGPHAVVLRWHLRHLVAALWLRGSAWRWAAATHMLAVAAIFEEAAAAVRPAPPPATRGLRPVRAAQDYISRHLGERGLVGRAAQASGVSLAHLERIFRQVHGVTPQQWVDGLRMQRACMALIHGSGAVGAAAEVAGLPDPRYFSRFCRRHMGLTPSAYRRQYAGRASLPAAGSTAAHPSGASLEQGPAEVPHFPCNVHYYGE
jgi:AraC-like DNA-binding protein